MRSDFNNKIIKGDDTLSNTVWLIIAVVFALLEGATVGLVCIWFSGGALAAWICATLGLGIWWQVGIFIAVTALLLIFTRPVVKKLLSKSDSKTNLDRIIGKSVVISEKVDNLAQTGRCVINGVSWSVRSDDGEVLERGETVTVKDIEGVHLVVKK